jgi:nucleotide-binding universal stress UspA family protein
MFKRILVPLDGSRLGSRALKYAIEVTKRFDAEIILLQILRPTPPVFGMGPAGIASAAGSEVAFKAALEEDKTNVTRASRYLNGKVRLIKKQEVAASSKVIVGPGEAASHIVSFSKKEKIDLIVMTTHGKSGFKRAILGSVADSVIRESGKPVLAIRPKAS